MSRFDLFVVAVALAAVGCASSNAIPGSPNGIGPAPTSPPTRAGTTINVPAGGDFQAALDRANPGDTIVLQAGSRYVGNFTLPVKPPSSQYVTVTSTSAGQLPPTGQRVAPNDAAHMAALISPANGTPVINAASGAHHYQFVGIEIAPAAGKWAYELVALGTTESTLAQVPHDFIFDRVYVHGDPVAGTKRGIQINCSNATIENSYISEIHLVGQDSQAIAGWNGPGPFTIVNNYLSAAGENVLFGGARSTLSGVIPSNVTIRHNYFFKPLFWLPTDPSYAGIHWSVKNLLEFKNAQNVVVDGNVFANNWADAQNGFAILLTVRTEYGTMPWAVVDNVRFSNNLVMHAGSGVNMAGQDGALGHNYGGQVAGVVIKNNLFEDISASWGGAGVLYQVLDKSTNVMIDHNTGLQTGDYMSLDGPPGNGAVVTNNISPHNLYGVAGSGFGIGTPALNAYLPGSTFSHNVLAGGNASSYPLGNYFPVSMAAVMFNNPGAGDYSLANASPYRNLGTDGKDLGVDMSALNAATAGAVQGH